MRPENILVVFDKPPRYAVGKYQLTIGKKYEAKAQNLDLGLYSIVDDAGVRLNVTTVSMSPFWHICKPEGCQRNSCEPEDDDDCTDGSSYQL